MTTIILSRGNVDILAALYAFGVIWSFAMKSLAVLVLRYTEPGNREWKVPGNFHIAGREVPVGLATISFVLFTTAVVNLFTYSEYRVRRERHGKPEQLDQFRIYGDQELGSGAMGVRSGNILVAVREPESLLPASSARTY